ncbi:MAG: SRPBCC family protein [Acidimicrobiia bacterium]|jgi:uncharacterized protein YndB with AHSA1/START domain
MNDVESVERVIPAPPEAIFALLADPSRHHEIDGSGTVRDAKDSPDRLTLGAKFGMAMHQGFGYSMENTVVEFEEGRRIAWQTRMPKPIVSKLVGGRIWRYELEPVDGGTRVRESWDISQESIKILVAPMRGKTRKSMEATLARIEEVATRDAR